MQSVSLKLGYSDVYFKDPYIFSCALARSHQTMLFCYTIFICI